MRSRKLLSLFLVPAACYCMAVGCGEDDKDNGDDWGDAGKAGTSGSTGKDGGAGGTTGGDSSTGGTGGGSTGGTGGSGGSTTAGSGGGSAAGTGGSGTPPPKCGGQGGGTSCAATTTGAVLMPIDLFIMMDASGSMAEPTETGGKTKWQAVIDALTTFVSDPSSKDVGVGIQYFPLPVKTDLKTCADTYACGSPQQFQCLPDQYGQKTCADVCTTGSNNCGSGECGPPNAIGSTCTNVTCDQGLYGAPDVEISLLSSGSSTDLIASMQNNKPNSGTPTLPALKGGIAHVQEWAKAHPDRRAVVVLATDGLPTLCPVVPDGDVNAEKAIIEQLKTAASAAANSDPKVRTFVIGTKSTTGWDRAETNLNEIAAAGGSKKATIVSLGASTTTEFANALRKIRGSMDCNVKLPGADAEDGGTSGPTLDGGALDYAKVNVEFTGDAGECQVFYKVTDASKCDSNGGWHYDIDPKQARPTKIILCPTSCDQVQNNPDAKINVAIGCESIQKPLT